MSPKKSNKPKHKKEVQIENEKVTIQISKKST